MNVFETYAMPNAPEDSRVHKFLDYVVKTYISEDLFGRHAMRMRNVQLTAVKASELSFTHSIPIHLISWNSLRISIQKKPHYLNGSVCDLVY